MMLDVASHGSFSEQYCFFFVVLYFFFQYCIVIVAQTGSQYHGQYPSAKKSFLESPQNTKM